VSNAQGAGHVIARPSASIARRLLLSQLPLVTWASFGSFILVSCSLVDRRSSAPWSAVCSKGSVGHPGFQHVAPPAQSPAYLAKAQSKCQVIGRTGCILIRCPGSLPPTDEAAPALVQEIRALQPVPRHALILPITDPCPQVPPSQFSAGQPAYSHPAQHDAFTFPHPLALTQWLCSPAIRRPIG
jgi:hypothetical protein